MLEPKRVKRRRVHRANLKGNANRGHQINFGDFALKAMEPKFITSRQIEACRIAIARSLQRDGQTFIRVFPDKPLTAKPLETRMGKGKGPVDQWVMNIKPGRIIFEMAGVEQGLAREALTLALHKLPFKCKIITAEMNNEIF